MQPFAKTPARLAWAPKRDRKPAGIEGQQTDRARSDHALGGVDPADGRGRRQRVEIVHDDDQPIRRRSRPGRVSDPRAERGEELARRARRRMARFQKFRPGGPHGRLASGALARGFGALGGRVSFRRQRCDSLIEASGARLEVLATVSGLLGQEPSAAQQKVREPERAPQVERDGQGAEDEQNLCRSIEPVAVRRHPIPGRLQRVASVLDRVGRCLAVQKTQDEGEHEGEDAPEEQPRLTAVGPD